MIIGRILHATRVLGAPEGWQQEELPCGALPVRDERTCVGNRMISAWEPDAKEIAAIVAGAPIYLSVFGEVHPPVALFVGEPPTEPTL
jgi:hypothetical protein